MSKQKLRNLSKVQIAVLQALITLWRTQDAPVHIAMVARHMGTGDSNVSRAIARLSIKKFVEVIRFDGRRLVELKPLKNPDGSDFFSNWTPIVPPRKAVLKIPSSAQIIAAEKARAVREATAEARKIGRLS